MSMSGFSIRRLVSKRSEGRSSVDFRERECSVDEEGFQDPSSPDSKDTTRKESWFTTNRKQGKSWPSTSKFSFRPRSLPYNISSILLPLSSTETSASSSASSLCSCDRHGSPSLAGRSRSTLCSLGSRDENSELSLHASSATSYDGNTSSPSPLPEEGDNDTDSTPTQSRLNSSRTDVDQAQESMPSGAEDKDKDTSRPGSGVLDDAADTGVRHSVEEFIQEANKAFKIGNSFREVNATRTSFNETPRLPPAEVNNTAALPRRRTSVQRKSNKKIYRFARPGATATPISPANSVRRKASVKTVKRKKSTKARQPMKPHRKSLGPKPANKNNSKWTENMSDLLSGKLFSKIEADEMLTPAQLEAYKLRRLSKLQLAAREAAASETSLALETAETVETPVEPFHMDDLPSRIGSSGVKLTASTPVEERPDAAILKETAKKAVVVSNSDNNADELFLGQATAMGSSSGALPPSSDFSAPTQSSTLQDGHSSQHSTQNTSPSRYIFRKIPDLPTISENTTTATRGDEELFLTHNNNTIKGRRSDSTTSNTATLDPDYVYLRSTPYTLTAPRFRHGPIRLARADCCPGPEPRMIGGRGGGDQLDWTAFQMAILGGAGDLYFFNNSNTYDSERQARQHAAADADAICAWWDELGFEDGYGALVTSPSLLDGNSSSQNKDHHQYRPQHHRSSSRIMFPTLSSRSSSRRPSATTTTISSSSCSSCDASSDSSAGESNSEDTQLYHDIGRDNPYSPKHKWETLRRRAVLEGRGSVDLNDAGNNKAGRKGRRSKHHHGNNNNKLYRTSSGNNKKKSAETRESLLSMPQSPMLDYQVMTSDNGDVDIVPMGYNLSHDLGDFLSWENENVHLGNAHYDDNFI